MKILISTFKCMGLIFLIFIKVSKMCILYLRQEKEVRELWKAGIGHLSKESDFKVCGICGQKKPIKHFLFLLRSDKVKFPEGKGVIDDILCSQKCYSIAKELQEMC